MVRVNNPSDYCHWASYVYHRLNIDAITASQNAYGRCGCKITTAIAGSVG